MQKPYIKDYKLLLVQDLLMAACHQILLIILLKEFIKFNVNTDTMIKDLKLAKLNTRIATDFLNTQTFKMIWLNTYVYVIKRITKKLMKISISLFYCCERSVYPYEYKYD